MNKKNNQRFEKTHELIENTYLQLISTGKKANVSSICKLAGINRASFYLHFIDIMQLEQSIDRRLMGELLELVYNSPNPNEYVWSREFFASFLKHVKDNRIFYLSFYQKYFEIIRQGNYSELYGFSNRAIGKDAIPKPPSNLHSRALEIKESYLLGYYEAGITMVVLQWINNECRESIEDMCDFLMDILKQ